MADFLVMPYRVADFLCLMGDIVGSSVREAEGGRVRFGGLLMDEIDIDGWLRSVLPRMESAPTAELTLVYRMPGEAPSRLVGLRVVSESFVVAYPLSDFRLLPFVVRAALRQRGILATRSSPERIQYLLHLPVLLGTLGRGVAT